MNFLSAPPARPRFLPRRRALRPRVAGTVVTTKKEVLVEADKLDKGIRSLEKDTAENLYRTPEMKWENGCETGFSDAYTHGYYGTGGVKEPIGTPPYVAAYRRAFSSGSGFALGKAAKESGKYDSATAAMRNEDPVAIRSAMVSCRAGLDAWLAENPQEAPPKAGDAHVKLSRDLDEFGSRWRAFYTSLYDIGVFESGDAAIEQIRGYHNEYMELVRRYEALGFKASYVAPPPVKAPPNPLTTLASGLGTAVTVAAVGAIGYFGLKLYLERGKR